jgi:murein DD-endopeptidase MepM/ murein hydrolase activator NlpD
VHKGIDIGGNRGDPVYAVADGTVVYAGTGIVGFGELIILKHNRLWAQQSPAGAGGGCRWRQPEHC